VDGGVEMGVEGGMGESMWAQLCADIENDALNY
jgi:hypothetical protein